MKKVIVFIFGIFITISSFGQHGWEHGRLKISANGHYLQYDDGAPFFWLGDTGWDLFQKLKKGAIVKYLENRKQKGFNVIQSVILDDDTPNQYGNLSLKDHDPGRPVERYFELVDWVVKKALEKQMFMALLPTWGDKVNGGRHNEQALFNEANAYAYGLFLGQRYRDYPNIVWIIGGDHPAFVDSADWRPIWISMVKGLREGTGNKALITYHPAGESSSTRYWKNGHTIDFNMMQSGHRVQDLPVWDWVKRDWATLPTKPILDGEPNYEDHPINWNPQNGYFRAYDVRKQLYRSVFSGACGVTYGDNAIFQFYGPHDEKHNFPERFWTEAMNRPGAFQAGFLKRLILSRPCLTRIPDQTIIKSGQGEKGAYMTAFRDKDGSYAMVYLPVGKEIKVGVSWLKAAKVVGWWFNPRTGKAQKIGVVNRQNTLSFVPPALGIGNDWVLLLEDAAKKRPTPATLPD